MSAERAVYARGADISMMLALQVKTQYGGASNDAAYRLAQQVASSQGGGGSEWGDNTGEGLETKVNNFFAALDAEVPGSLRSSGCINTRNEAQQTLLHIATVMGFHLLLRRLVSLGADLDVQDGNGYTALAFACLMGRTECARVLIEAGAAYDRPTGFGEMPLDLSKIAEHTEVESLVLSAVWSTKPREKPTPPASTPSLSTIPNEPTKPAESVASSVSLTSSLDPFGADRAVEPTRSVESGRSISTDSIDSVDEIDGDNPSDASDEEVVGMTKPKKLNRKRPARISLPRSRRASISVGPVAAAEPAPADDPPPYERVVKDVNAGTMTIQLPLPDMVWNRLPLPVHDLLADGKTGGWVTISAPSWETLTKMTNPEEVRMFTQAMAAAAMNAVVQSGATTSAGALTDGGRKGRRKTRSTAESRDSSSAGTGASSPRRKKIAQQVKSESRLHSNERLPGWNTDRRRPDVVSLLAACAPVCWVLDHGHGAADRYGCLLHSRQTDREGYQAKDVGINMSGQVNSKIAYGCILSIRLLNRCAPRSGTLSTIDPAVRCGNCWISEDWGLWIGRTGM